MKNVMPMQPYLVLDTDDYEVKKEMKSGISHFYEFSKKKSLKEERKAVCQTCRFCERTAEDYGR